MESMSADSLAFLKTNPDVRPAAKVRRQIAEVFAAEGPAAWERHCGQTGWSTPTTVGCPWSGLEVPEIWAPLSPKLKTFAKELEKRTLALMVRETAEGWQLGYVLELGTSKEQHYNLSMWVGGPPDPNPMLTKELTEAEWEIPSELKQFYALHNGFGPFVDEPSGETSFGVGSLLSSTQLETLPALIGTHTDGTPMIEDHSFLAFFIDSVGHRRGYYRQAMRMYKKGFDWDRHTKEASQMTAPLGVMGRELLARLRS